MGQNETGVRRTTGSQLRYKPTCRVCDMQMIPFYDYGLMPIANQLHSSRNEALNAKQYPLLLTHCPNCGNIQISCVVDPDILYSEYTYRSSVSKMLCDHFRDLSSAIVRECDVLAGDKILDIAGNDGAFLIEFLKEKPGIIPILVDPSSGAIADAPDDFHKFKNYWGIETASEIKMMHGRARVVVATNVVGHVDDVHQFFEAVSMAMADHGVFVVEIGHGYDLVKNCEFDSVYHEHLSYFSERALQILGRMHGLTLTKVEPISIHHGYIRAWFKKAEAPIVAGHQLTEWDFDKFSDKVENKLRYIQSKIDSMEGFSIGVTSSAKTSVILNQIDCSKLQYIVENAKPKIGKWLGGVGIEIKEFSRENVENADSAIILSRNIVPAMEQKLRENGFKGEIVSV